MEKKCWHSLKASVNSEVIYIYAQIYKSIYNFRSSLSIATFSNLDLPMHTFTLLHKNTMQSGYALKVILSGYPQG